MQILRYPATVQNVEGNKIPYKSCDYIENITNDLETYAVWGYHSPGRKYINAIAGRNGSRKHPSTIKCSNFQFPIHDNAKVIGIIVQYAYRKKSYSSETAHGSFANPVIKINPYGLTANGNAPPKNDFGEYQVAFNNLNLRGRDVNSSNFNITFDLPANTNTNPCYIQMKYFRVILVYTSSNYVPTLEISPSEFLFNQTAKVKLAVQETSGTVPSENVPISLPLLSGFEYRDLPTLNNGKINLITKNHKAEALFSIKPTTQNSGLYNLTATELITNHSVKGSFVVKTPNIECWDFGFNNHEIEVSNNENTNISTLQVSLWSDAPLDMNLNFDFNGLEINDSNIENGVLAISVEEWGFDSNVDRYLFEVMIPVYGYDQGIYDISMSSDMFMEIYSDSIKIVLPDVIDPYYSVLQVSDFTLGNLVDGERYIFSCLARIYDANNIYPGQKNNRVCVINGDNESYTEQISIAGEWQELTCEFVYDSENPLFILFYGNSIEFDDGTPEFGNLCIILKERYMGYEYPVLSLNPQNRLLYDLDYANVVLEPPEHPLTTKHFFTDLNWQGLEDSNVTIHGIEIKGDISTSEPVNVVCGLGNTNIDEAEYYLDSSFITPEQSTFLFGGKFQSFGIPFDKINGLLNQLRFFIQIDDGFDNITPFYVDVKNVTISVYYSLSTGEDCDFYIDGVSSKYYLIAMKPDTEIPRGANFDAKTLKIDGADGEYPLRVNVENKKIKLKFFVYGDDFQESTELMKYVSNFLYPERDELDDPILKSIMFFFDKEHCYDYYIEDAIETEAVVGGYECKVDLIVPSGLNRTLEKINKSYAGTITTIGKVKPEVYFYKIITSELDNIQIIESETGKVLILEGDFIRNLPEFTKFKIDCEERKIYYEQYGEWFLIDPNCINIDSSFFTIENHFNFENSINCKVTAVKYFEYGG